MPPQLEDVPGAREFAFAKAFKRDYGVAPGAYRRYASTGYYDVVCPELVLSW